MHVRFVLVEPREAGNVGAVARAIKNFGFSDLWIAGPRPQRVDAISEWWAKGATELVHAARRVDTLEEALQGVHLSVATTAVRARHVFEELRPNEVARLAEEQLGDEHILAIVFGREERGLSGAEIALCQRTASIETAPEAASMNLAQAVAIFAYELSKGLRTRRPEADPAPAELLRVLFERANRLMTEIDYFGDRSPARMLAELQALAGRAHLSTREASLLLSFVAHVEKAIGQRNGTSGRREK